MVESWSSAGLQPVSVQQQQQPLEQQQLSCLQLQPIQPNESLDRISSSPNVDHLGSWLFNISK